MATFEDWEIHKAPCIDENGEVKSIVHKWDSYEIRNAEKFIDELQSHLNNIDCEKRAAAELKVITWTDRDDCPEGSITLSYQRPATERELQLVKFRQRKSIKEDQLWLKNKIANLIADAEETGLSAADLGISFDDDSYTINFKSANIEE